MVLEEIKARFIEQRPYAAIAIGFAYTIIGYAAARFLFRADLSVSMLFLTTLLLVPTLVHVLHDEEEREKQSGTAGFFHNHIDIVESYLFLFIGIFAGYLVLGLMLPSHYETMFSFQTSYLADQQGLTPEAITTFLEGSFQPTVSHVLGIVEKNIFVAILFFMLSVFYGAGAVFLLVLNASVFSSFVHVVIQQLASKASEALSILAFFSVHLIPEVSGFLVASIAGGVVSRAFVHETFGSKGFRNVMKDSVLLLLISLGLIMIGAILEVYVTTHLFRANF